MKTLNIKYIIPFALIVFSACSTKKNTGASRGYHNLTSRYNILFNGTESYKKGMLTLQNNYVDDYNELLPIFIYGDPDQLSAISSDMDRSEKKATKIVSLHSITAKPEIKEGEELSQNDRAFYSKNEFNKWVDDAYLLMGKAYFHKNELIKASQTFEYMIANYPDEPTLHESKLWLARIALQKNKFKVAEEYISELDKNIELPKYLLTELFATKAHKAVLEEDYQKAISFLKKALEETHTRYYKQRYNYILAQLYQKIRQTGNASRYYKEVIKLNPPYVMTFNAKINMALTYESGKGSRREIEKQLQKMLRDDKNIDYQDQIYFAWGNIYFKAGDIEKALEYYVKSASASKDNTSQLALTYLTIADINYNKPEYVLAQSYYDSAVRIIDMEYPDYPVIYAKSISLTNLVTHIETVELQDSVQKLSKLSQPELYAFIDNLIANERKAQEEERIRKEEELLQSNFETQQQFELQTNKESNWYFYNPTSLNLGKQEFRKKWGPRKLEDNWRRKNKNTVSYDSPGEIIDGEFTDENGNPTNKKLNASSKFSREYYLMDIPKTDSAIAASHEMIQFALFEMGGIYSNELKDYDKAIGAYTELLKRYPNNSNRLATYYQLYTIGKQTENKNLFNKYQQKIISEYPNSNYAKVLTDPEYFKKLEEEAKRTHVIYAQTYENFKNRNYAQVIRLSQPILSGNPEHELIPQFEYMFTVSKGVNKDTAQFIGDLEKLISKYPGSEIANNATLLVGFLQDINPEAAIKHEIKEAVQLYKIDFQEEHYAIAFVRQKTKSNQMMFNIINFNIDNFEESDLKVRKFEIDEGSLLSIVSFQNSGDARNYLAQLSAFPDLWRDVDKGGSELFLISASNYELLKSENKLNQYLLFYKKQY